MNICCDPTLEGSGLDVEYSSAGVNFKSVGLACGRSGSAHLSSSNDDITHLVLKQMQSQIGGAIQGKRRRTVWSLSPCRRSSDEEDTLSLLPDEALSRIMSKLPTKDAAILTLISPKIMPAFSLLTNFEFDDSPISYCLGSRRLVERTPVFKKFIDYVLRACQSNHLVSFTLRFGRFCRDNKRMDYSFERYKCGEHGECHPPVEPARLNAWISFPLARNVRELDLCIHVKRFRGCRKLPRSIFVCETLETLKLDSNLDLGVDDVKTFPIRLPRLKLLHLRTLLFSEDEIVTKLVNSCPVLEGLLMACWWEFTDVFTISSPSLLKLDLSLFKCVEDMNSTNFILHTPNLQSFKYWDNLADHYSISNMNALVQAEITIILELGPDESCSNVSSILKSCATVSHLSLLNKSVPCLDYIELKNRLPVFHNLIYVELGQGCSANWDKVLVEFLERSPFLNTIVFPEGLSHPIYREFNETQIDFEGCELERQCWRTTQAIPSCCKSHLKRIVIKDYSGHPRDLPLIQFLLEKALVLESLDISLYKKIRYLDLDPGLVQSALQEMPRASKCCSIKVL